MKAKELRALLIILALNLVVVIACVWDLTHKETIETEDEWIYETEDVIRWRFDEVDEEVIVELLESEPVAEPELVSLGTFRLTAFCDCEKCCGKWSGSPTASGTTPTQGRTIAVDTSIIPFGTEVIINGVTYIAEDTGSGIDGNCIDIFFNSHQEALEFGVQYAEVFIKESN